MTRTRTGFNEPARKASDWPQTVAINRLASSMTWLIDSLSVLSALPLVELMLALILVFFLCYFSSGSLLSHSLQLALPRLLLVTPTLSFSLGFLSEHEERGGAIELIGDLANASAAALWTAFVLTALVATLWLARDRLQHRSPFMLSLLASTVLIISSLILLYVLVKYYRLFSTASVLSAILAYVSIGLFMVVALYDVADHQQDLGSSGGVGLSGRTVGDHFPLPVLVGLVSSFSAFLSLGRFHTLSRNDVISAAVSAMSITAIWSSVGLQVVFVHWLKTVRKHLR